MSLFYVDLRGPEGALDAVVDAVVTRRQLHLFAVYHCALSPAAAPTLARALRDGALRSLVLGPGSEALLDAAGASVLAAAIRSSRKFRSLWLHHLPLAAPALRALLGPLEGHHSLWRLRLRGLRLDDPAAAGAALAALLAADAPALNMLDVSDCDLGEAGLGALLDALPRNSHLYSLNIRSNDVPAGFMRARLLPAVRANASLRKLLVDNPVEIGVDDHAARQEVQRILAAR